MLEIENVAKSLHFAGVVVEHQQNAGKGEHEEQVKSDPANSPGVGIAHRIPIDLGGMKVQENVGKKAKLSIALRVILFVAKNGRVELRLRRILQAFDLFFGFGGE